MLYLVISIPLLTNPRHAGSDSDDQRCGELFSVSSVTLEGAIFTDVSLAQLVEPEER